MRIVWLALAFVGTLAVGLLLGLLLGAFGTGGEQGSTPPPRTVTVEKTVPTRETPKPATTTPTHGVGSLDEARSAFERAVEGFGNPNLKVTEVMEFANNYYAEVEEKDTGMGAMELLISRSGSRVYQEPGPNMMWNTKYGMMAGGRGFGGMMGPNGGGMMGGYGSSAPSRSAQGSNQIRMPVNPEQAREVADAYLSRVSPGTKAEEPTRFYGYYTIDTEKNDKTSGMLSVNGYSGEVWYHSWHGPFVAKEEDN